MRYGRLIGRVDLIPRGVNMNPLPIFGYVGEIIDPLLGNVHVFRHNRLGSDSLNRRRVAHGAPTAMAARLPPERERIRKALRVRID